MSTKIQAGNRVIWKDPSCLDQEDKDNLQILKAYYGEGPFTVIKVIRVSEKDRNKRHRRLLTLSDKTGEMLSLKKTVARITEFWFVKTKNPA